MCTLLVSVQISLWPIIDISYSLVVLLSSFTLTLTSLFITFFLRTSRSATFNYPFTPCIFLYKVFTIFIIVLGPLAIVNISVLLATFKPINAMYSYDSPPKVDFVVLYFAW